MVLIIWNMGKTPGGSKITKSYKGAKSIIIIIVTIFIHPQYKDPEGYKQETITRY